MTTPSASSKIAIAACFLFEVVIGIQVSSDLSPESQHIEVGSRVQIWHWNDPENQHNGCEVVVNGDVVKNGDFGVVQAERKEGHQWAVKLDHHRGVHDSDVLYFRSQDLSIARQQVQIHSRVRVWDQQRHLNGNLATVTRSSVSQRGGRKFWVVRLDESASDSTLAELTVPPERLTLVPESSHEEIESNSLSGL